MGFDMKDSRILVIMNFSGGYEAEGFYKNHGYVWVDCKDIKGTTVTAMRKGKMQSGKQSGNWGQRESISWIPGTTIM